MRRQMANYVYLIVRKWNPYYDKFLLFIGFLLTNLFTYSRWLVMVCFFVFKKKNLTPHLDAFFSFVSNYFILFSQFICFSFRILFLASIFCWFTFIFTLKLWIVNTFDHTKKYLAVDWALFIGTMKKWNLRVTGNR